jgi:hypothetical protein
MLLKPRFAAVGALVARGRGQHDRARYGVVGLPRHRLGDPVPQRDGIDTLLDTSERNVGRSNELAAGLHHH